MLTVGIFEITHLSADKWLVKNTITTFEHRTYGTQAEVEAEYKYQSDVWEKRVKESGTHRTKGKFGGGPVKKAG